MTDEVGPVGLVGGLHACPTCGTPCSRFMDGAYRGHLRPAEPEDSVVLTFRGRDYTYCETGVVIGRD